MPDGTFGRSTYSSRRRTSELANSLHSLYVALWANFACFCIGLLTQPEAESGIKGRIISGVLPVRHYCLSQLNKQWLHMQSYMQMSSLEELSFFIMKMSQQLLQVYACAITFVKSLCSDMYYNSMAGGKRNT